LLPELILKPRFCADEKHFRRESDIPRDSRIPLRNVILKRVDDLVNMFIGSEHSVRTIENAEQVRAVAKQSLKCLGTLTKVAHGHLTYNKQVPPKKFI
jgi:hypothetical protein